MPVNLDPPAAGSLQPVTGVALGIAQAGIKHAQRDDLLLIRLDEGTTVAGVFTNNRFCAAPVVLARQHLAAGRGVLALVVNTGNANAGTGEQGMLAAQTVCGEVARLLGGEHEQVLPYSTGVIMEPLPVDKIIAGLPQAVSNLKADNWHAAARAIMTTDIVPKAVSRQVQIDGRTVTVTGIAKGSGMIHPDMATMLGYIATDADIAQPLLQLMVRDAANASFNCITVDGDTSTNDALMLIATGKSGVVIDAGNRSLMQEIVTDVAKTLAQAIVRDGEGATKFITIEVAGGKDETECRKVGFAIAHSPLVKTAFFASDPNLGRILAAIGYAGIADLDVEKIRVYLDDVLVAEKGGRAASYQEADGQHVMRQSDITILVELNRGVANTTLWTCDFSYDYVKINASYRS